ncbi:MAG: carbon starvation protein [Deltaproteobacteria bacterium]|nr:carbon starvation protein [Deltaproteobacteria bacterium]MBP1717779.1 carbon starvation protein [Deltaproteobacteria bacterium]
MITFWSAVVLLILGYFVYGLIVEKVFGVDNSKKTPAVRLQDGVDYVPMSSWRIFLIQFLNIAGLGPIFGAIAGAYWGPAAYLWIVFGTIFAGGVHDFFSGMMSARHDGKSVSELVGNYLGKFAYVTMVLFSIVLLVLVGVVFVKGPADLLHSLTPNWLSGFVKDNTLIWIALVFVYYFLATMLPIDVLIGRIYPLFGLLLFIMAVGLVGGIMLKGYPIPELTLQNLHPKHVAIFPFLFISIACGAISGFHSTQSPIMARCLKEEKYGRRIFYGAMVGEGIVALIWAMTAQTFFGSTEALAAAGTPAVVVHKASFGLLGTVGGILAVLGVIVCPITSGDTAFRSARLTIADCLNFSQKENLKRLCIAVPMFVIAIGLTFIDFNILWRYFAWSNQTLAMIVLWTGSAFLVHYNRSHWITTIPATFMSAVSVAYILQAKEGFKISADISNVIGIVFAIALFAAFMYKVSRKETRHVGSTSRIPVEQH